MDSKKSTWLAELSVYLILPTLAYLVFASSSIWASGNPYWTSFYSYYSSSSNINTFNFWAAIIILGGTALAFVCSIASVIYNIIKDQKSKFVVMSAVVAVFTGLILLSLLLFYSGVNIFTAFVS